MYGLGLLDKSSRGREDLLGISAYTGQGPHTWNSLCQPQHVCFKKDLMLGWPYTVKVIYGRIITAGLYFSLPGRQNAAPLILGQVRVMHMGHMQNM